jgi:hypothetical protein
MVLSFLITLPLYLILGVVWRLSVLSGYPVGEVKNKKWRLGLLITFGITALVGIILGIVGMGNSGHFRDAHGVSTSFVVVSFKLIVSGIWTHCSSVVASHSRLHRIPPSFRSPLSCVSHFRRY